ncbi:MAG: type II toxin-antitoxin system RelE/ParE family toxin [Myxococcales bacterium]|nr:type II toxin-antitoxin system RelE/ParE family toxin [Myxococcales bacterium]
MTVRFTALARREFSASIEWLVERNPDAAQSLRDRLLAVVTSLEAREFEGREVTIARGVTVHRWPVGTLVIYYRRKGDALLVLRVFEARREPIER